MAPPQAQMLPPPGPAADDAGDDSFGFFSDDDAFLACVDMGEGDLGRPIDFEEGAGGSTVSSGDEAPEAAPQPDPKQPDDRYGPMGLGRTGQSVRPAAQQQWGAMNPPPNLPQQQKAYVAAAGVSNVAPRSGPEKPISGGSTAPSRPNDNRAPSTAGSASRLLAIANNSRSGASTSNQNQKPSPQNEITGAASASGSGPTGAPPPARRPSTPSVGGFHFPPGMPVRTSSCAFSLANPGLRRRIRSCKITPNHRPQYCRV
jgi:DNA repair and recombination protein RAD52